MSLTREELKRAKRWLQTKASTFKCQVCGERSWKIETDAALGSIVRGQAYMHGSVRVILVGCAECGHLLLFSDAILEQ